MNKPKVGLLPLYVKLYDDYLQWMRPKIEAFHKTITAKLEEVLEEYSRNGGTHHSAMVYGVSAEAIKPLARQFGWKFVTL